MSSILESVQTGDLAESLEALRDMIAAEIDTLILGDCDPTKLSSLVKSLVMVMEKLDDLKGADDESELEKLRKRREERLNAAR